MGEITISRNITFQEDIVIEMLQRMADGETLTSIAKDKRMPSIDTMNRWEDDQKSELGAAITRARATGYTVRAEKILETVNTATDPQKARLQFDAERWFLGKMCPKKFGDATMIKHADADGERIELDPVARVTRLAGIFQQIEARKEGDEGE